MKSKGIDTNQRRRAKPRRRRPNTRRPKCNARRQLTWTLLLCLRTSVTNLPQDIGDTRALFGGDTSPRSLRNEPCRTR